MALIEKNTVLIVGYELIDRDHEEFIALLNQLDSASNADFPVLFQQLHEHTEQHFDRENQLMMQFAYPGEIEHKGEHQRVLGEFRQFKTRVNKGMITFGRSFVRERLPQWFGLHVTTMDSALVAHINNHFLT
jgi:hemerythrin-like metal-binding protein